jgi:hypothetical protein
MNTVGCECAVMSEDVTKQKLLAWLERDDWTVRVAWGRERGVDILATKDGQRWLIEVKGCGSHQPMRVNYFLCVLGEVLQRMSEPEARYSVAFPDLSQFRGLWQRLPSLTKQRLGLTALFVDAAGGVCVES